MLSNHEKSAEIGRRAIDEINRIALEDFGYFVDISDNNPNAYKIATYAALLALESQEEA